MCELRAKKSQLSSSPPPCLIRMSQTVVVGGGLAGLSAAHTILERGGRVVVLDKCAFLGGNSTKATSGINGALTNTQINKGVADSKETFYEDTAKSAGEGLREPLVKTLTYGSGPAVDWLQESFGIDLSLVAFMGAHSNPRTHRGKERFPGAAITMGPDSCWSCLSNWLRRRWKTLAVCGDQRIPAGLGWNHSCHVMERTALGTAPARPVQVRQESCRASVAGPRSPGCGSASVCRRCVP